MATIQGVGVTKKQICINTKVRETNKIIFQGLANLDSWRIKKSKDKITRDGQDWWWCPNHKMEGKFDGMYMNHPPNKHGEWSKGKHSKREA